jgi:polyisoprenoid-binding protein YceI
MTATATPEIRAGTWQIDASHSSAQFAVRHLMIATVKGCFNDLQGSVSYDPAQPGSVDIDVRIPVASVDTREPKRDEHLKSDDFFNAEKYPFIAFKGTRVEGDVNRKFRLVGDLTIRDVTREVVLDVTNEGAGSDPWGNERVGFSASTKFNRTDYGLKWNVALEAGGVMVSDEVKVSLDVQLMRPAA